MNPHDLIALIRSARLAPPIRRGSMVAQPWTGFIRSLGQILRGQRSRQPTAATPAPWEQAASRRRMALVALIGATTLGVALLLARTQPAWDHPVLRITQILLFALLTGWVAAGFFTALMGFLAQLRPDPFALSLTEARSQTLGGDARTAIIMPICNEHVATVFAGLRATCESLAASSASDLFDVYVLSDTSDPTLRAQELAAWATLRDTLGDGSRLYYRLRERRTRRKAGNVADFCRRWGRNYRYMVVLDADSVMSGENIATLVRLMEAHPKAGIIQTAPQACGVDTLHARAQQFAGRVTGRLFTAGMQYWQLGESHYWGHNAIIRIEPFMKHCALAPLPGRGGLSGDILSHDFVEAALMRRAGYHTWLVPTLEGSYEQQPPNLLEELQRDRRWCQGNLKNVRLIAEPGLQAVHRAMLATGAMAYLSAPLWLGFVLVSLSVRLLETHSAKAFNPLANASPAFVGLWIATLILLFLPRVLAVAAILMRREQESYGGTAQLVKSALLESGLSALQAPIRMMAHTLFVLTALTGIGLDWKSPPREAASIGWSDAARRFAPLTAAALAMLLVTLVSSPGSAWWLLPVGLPLLLAIPVSVATSQTAVGNRLRAQGLLVTPEERHAPEVMLKAWSYTTARTVPERTVPIATPAPWHNPSQGDRAYSGAT